MNRSILGLFSEAFYRTYSIWHVRHRLRKSFRSFKSKRAANKYYKSIAHCKTRKIKELRPPGAVMLETICAKNPILERLKK